MADLTSFLTALLLGFPCAYLVRFMILERRTGGHSGPFKSKRPVRFPLVIDPVTGIGLPPHEQPAALADYIRFLFGAYKRTEGVWLVKMESSSAQVFTCFFCLSFWIALLFSVPYGLMVNSNVFWMIAYHFGIATVAQVVYKHLWAGSQ